MTDTPKNGYDEALVKAAASGDRAAFTTLYHRFSPSIYNMALRSLRDRADAEDICQDVWIKVYGKLRDLRDPRSFPAWLYRMTARACIDAASKRSRPAASETLAGDHLPTKVDDLEGRVMQRERWRLSWEALGSLPVRQHLALFLKEVEGRGYAEIAVALETSESAVETLLFRARRKLAHQYERLEADKGIRCEQARGVMAALIDGESTAVHQRALRAHAEACRTCHRELIKMRRGETAYRALALAPVPAALSQQIFASIGLTASGGTIVGAAKLVTAVGAKTKLLAATLTVTTALTTGLIAEPPLPEPAFTSPDGAATAVPAHSPESGQFDDDPRNVERIVESGTASALINSGAATGDEDIHSESATSSASEISLKMEGSTVELGVRIDGLANGIDDFASSALDAEALQTPLAVAGLPPQLHPALSSVNADVQGLLDEASIDEVTQMIDATEETQLLTDGEVDYPDAIDIPLTPDLVNEEPLIEESAIQEGATDSAAAFGPIDQLTEEQQSPADDVQPGLP